MGWPGRPGWSWSPSGRAGPDPQFTAYADDVAEAAGVATAAAKLVAGGTRASEIAVLYRTNAQSEPLEQALAEAGVPYLLRGGERFFARREVRDAIVLLRGAARAADPDQPLGEATRDALVVGRLVGRAAGVRRPARSASAGSRCRRWPPWPTSWPPPARVPRWPTSWPSWTSGPPPSTRPTVEGVTLASLHAAKGLEWDAVFLVGLTEGLLPISFAEGLAAVEEERRLLYVGVTRAREHLALSWARARTPGRPSQPQAVAVPRRAAPGRRRTRTKVVPAATGSGSRRARGKADADQVPHLRQGPDDRRRAQGRPLLGLPAHL